MVDGQETPVLAARANRVPFDERVERRHALLRKRNGTPLAAENVPPVGQAALWHDDVIQCLPPSGCHVARQIARLCGDDSRVSIPLRSLANAVGRKDRAGNLVAYTERGIQCLVEAEWLRTTVTGAGQNIITTLYLTPGDRHVAWFPEDEDAWQEARI
jgi:hypothetical protein